MLNKDRVGECDMQKIKGILEEHSADIVRGLLAVILLLTLVIILFIYKGGKDEEDILEDQLFEELLDEHISEENSNEQIELSSVDEVEQKVIIDVKGAVEAPGVYQMEADSRIIDCIEKAGGFLIEAEQKSVNLAQRAEDQMVIYIPLKGEDLSEVEQLLPNQPKSDSVSDSNKVDINKATKEELKSLNGIGDTKAESIISYRETHGSFQKVEDLKNVSGIGDATFEKLSEAIQVTP